MNTQPSLTETADETALTKTEPVNPDPELSTDRRIQARLPEDAFQACGNSAPRQQHQSSDTSRYPRLLSAARVLGMCAVSLTPIATMILGPISRRSFEARNTSSIVAGSWAILSVLLILDKGLIGLVDDQRDPAGMVWLILGLLNLGSAIWLLCILNTPQL